MNQLCPKVPDKDSHFGEVNLVDVAGEYGTPLYVYSASKIRESCDHLVEHLPPRFRAHYSIKANPSIAICALIRQQKIAAEIASAGEQFIAKEAGYDGRELVYAGPGKSDYELTRACREGVAIINVESVGEIRRLDRIARGLGVTQSICIRINPSDENRGRGAIVTGGGPQKFGIDEEECADAIEIASACSGVLLRGFHFSTASQVLHVTHLLQAAKYAVDLSCALASRHAFPLEVINFGGGIGVPYSDTLPPFDLKKFFIDLAEYIANHEMAPVLATTGFLVEVGRYIVSDAGVFLSRVIDTKLSHGVRYAVIDGGINHFLLPITTNRYRARLINKPHRKGVEDVLVGGPLCTSADQWRASVPLANVEAGDLLAVFNAGAYGRSLGISEFLGHPSAAEVLIDRHQTFLIRRRTDVSMQRDQHLVPDHLL